MSKLSFRHFALVVIVVTIPLIPPATVQAAPAAPMPPASLALGGLSAERVAQIRDSGPPVMAEAADYEANAPITRLRTATASLHPLQSAVSNTRLYREVFGFAFASSLGDPTVGYPSWNFGLLSTVAYFGVHVAWNG